MQRRRLFALIACMFVAGGPAGLAQEPAPAAKSAESRPVADLSTRYSFRERYTTDAAGKPDAIGQYRVATRQTIKVSEERPQGAPVRSEYTVQSISTERPAQVSNTGAVLATVRQFEAYRQTPDPSPKASSSRLLEGLTVWYQPQEGGGPNPLVISLSEGRQLRELEYQRITTEYFPPDLSAVLPALPLRIDDKWGISRAGASALLGEMPLRGGTLAGRLVDVRQAANSADREAVFEIKGSVPVGLGGIAIQCVLNARVVFTFPAAADDAATAKESGDLAPVVAQGAITDLRMANTKTIPLPGRNSRLRKTLIREVIFGRQLKPTSAPLPIPDPPPKSTEANSWLTYEDAGGKFHFRHPQNLRAGPPEIDAVELVEEHGGVRDKVGFNLQPKTGDPEADRKNRDPNFHLSYLKEFWSQGHLNARVGQTGWLPESEWAASKMKVYRIEAVLMPVDPDSKKSGRVYFHSYLILFGRDESLVVTTHTNEDPPTAFHEEVEAIIKTFAFGRTAAR